MGRVGVTLFALLIVVYWGIGLAFSYAYALQNKAQADVTLLNYLWELPAIGIPVGVAVPLLLLRPVARDYDRMLRGTRLEDPAAAGSRLLRYPRRMVWYFTPVSIVAYLLGSVQSFYFARIPVDEFLKGVPLGLPLGLLISLAAYLAVNHYLEPVRRLFVLRHGRASAPPPLTSIYRKVVVSSITMVTLSLALLWLIAFAQGQRLLEDQLSARMEEATVPAAVEAVLHRGAPGYQPELAEVRLGERGYAFLVDATGVVRSDHPHGATSLAEEGWDAAQRGAIIGGGSGRFADRYETVRLVAFRQVPGTTDHVVVVTYRDDFAGPLADMSWAMLGATLLGLSVAAVLTLTGAHAVTRPVRELTEAMRRAREDGQGGETTVVTDDEVGALAASYAAMMARLSDKTKALEESVAKLRDMDALKTRFINIASHELRTPMTPIRTELHILRTGKRGPMTPEQQRGIDMVARNVDRLNRLIRDLLDASRMQAGQLRLVPRRVAVNELVSAALQTMQGEARTKGVELAAALDTGDEVQVMADEDRILQVLINLVENAIQFTPAGGKVTVLATEEGDHARLAVRDTGAGIEPHLLSRLFQPFSQAEPGVPRTEGGTGLGLFICRGIVEGHRGTIGVASEGAGLGSEFHFTLPLARAPGTAAAAAEPRSPPVARTPRGLT